MKHKPLSKDAKICARYLAARLRGHGDAEDEVADALTRLGAVSSGTPNEPRAMCVMDVVSATGWSRTRAAKWVLGEEAWEAEQGKSWHTRVANAKTETTLQKLKRERDAGIALYADSVSDTQAKRLVRATKRLTVHTMLLDVCPLPDDGDGIGT